MISTRKLVAIAAVCGLVLSSCGDITGTGGGGTTKTPMSFGKYLTDVQKAMPTVTSAGHQARAARSTFTSAVSGTFSDPRLSDVWTATNVPTSAWEPNWADPSGDSSVLNSIFGLNFATEGSIYGELPALDAEIDELNTRVADDNTSMQVGVATVDALPDGVQLPLPMGDVVVDYTDAGTPVMSSGGVIFQNGYELTYDLTTGSATATIRVAYFRDSTREALLWANNTDSGDKPHHLYYGVKKTMPNGDLWIYMKIIVFRSGSTKYNVYGARYEITTKGSSFFSFKSASGIQQYATDTQANFHCISGGGDATQQFIARNLMYYVPVASPSVTVGSATGQNIFIIDSALQPLYGAINVYFPTLSETRSDITVDVNGVVENLPVNTFGYDTLTQDTEVILPQDTTLGYYFSDPVTYPNGGLEFWTRL